MASLGFAVDAEDADLTRPVHLAARFGHRATVAALLGPAFASGFPEFGPYHAMDVNYRGRGRVNVWNMLFMVFRI